MCALKTSLSPDFTQTKNYKSCITSGSITHLVNINKNYLNREVYERGELINPINLDESGCNTNGDLDSKDQDTTSPSIHTSFSSKNSLNNF